MATKKEWSNELSAPGPDMIDKEMQRPTPREAKMTELAEQNKDVKPLLCNVTSKNGKAIRVIHDFYGQAITLQPLETKPGISLHPNAIAYFSNPKSDVEVVQAA